MKTETLDAIFTRKIAYTRASPFYRWLHAPHHDRFLPKPWKPATGEFVIDGSWSLRVSGRMDEPGPFVIEEIRSFFQEVGGFQLKQSSSDREIHLCVEGRAKDRLEEDSYSLKAGRQRVEIRSPTWRGVLFGVYYLEQLLVERKIPALKSLALVRHPAFDVRMFGEVYGTFTVSGLRIARPVDRNTFSAMSRFGANATFTFVQLGDYLDGSVYPELRNPKCEENLAELEQLANLCRSVGIDLYLDAYNPKLPSNHPVFIAHSNARGASQHGADMRSLCPSDPKTLRFIADSWANVFRRIPALGGMVAIIGGEGFYHCYMRAGKDGPDCPRCRERNPEEAVADLTNAVFHAMRKVKPDAELLAWPYSAHIWAKDPFVLRLVEKLDPDIQLVSEIDKDQLYQKKGYVKDIWDYSIDFLGPTERYKAQKAVVDRRRAKLCCKTETATSWECTSVPFIPCLQRWGRRMEIIQKQKPTSIYYAYDCTGFARSRPEELAGRMSWTPSGAANEEIRRMAVRDFGRGTAVAVMKAWNYFSQAIGHCPYLTHGYYRGPSFIGAAQPLMLKEENLPLELSGRFFYLAEMDLSEGTGEALKLRPAYAPDIVISPAEIADMDRAVVLWEKGVKTLESARKGVGRPYAMEFQKELNLGAYFLTLFRSVSHANHFFDLRKTYLEMTKVPVTARSDRAKVFTLLRKMEQIAQIDLRNAREALRMARRDPRPDLAVRLDLDYAPIVQMIQARIRFQKVEARRQFAAARAMLK
jgi:hypothetical protein